jgi:endo-1,4-beta-xylanase
MAAGKGKFLGNVWGSFGSPPLNYDIYWNQATPENDTKWGSVEGTRGSFNWTRADQIYTYCYNSGYPFKFHNLIWGQQTPGWLASLTDSATIAQEIELWIRTAGEHFISASFVDVVNEPLPGHNPPSAIVINALGGTGATGWDWVIKSFQLARQYWDKHVKLLINEYGIIGNNQATQNYLTIINILMTRGLIDGIGVQGHRFELETADTNTIKSNLDALAATGLPIYISEFDVAPQNTLDDAKQLAEMQRIFPVLWRHPGIKGITFWGYIQGLTWQTNAYLISSNSTERPAMQWLRTFMSSIVSDVAGQQRLPEEFGLSQNYPNPFNPSTFIDYDIPKQGLVSLTVYDVYGRELRTLVNEEKGAGHHTIRFEASDLPSGIYFYRIKAGDFSTVRRLALIK